MLSSSDTLHLRPVIAQSASFGPGIGSADTRATTCHSIHDYIGFTSIMRPLVAYDSYPPPPAMRTGAPGTSAPAPCCRRINHDTSAPKPAGLYPYQLTCAPANSSLKSAVAFKPKTHAPTSAESPYRCAVALRLTQPPYSNSPNHLIMPAKAAPIMLKSNY